VEKKLSEKHLNFFGGLYICLKKKNLRYKNTDWTGAIKVVVYRILLIDSCYNIHPCQTTSYRQHSS